MKYYTGLILFLLLNMTSAQMFSQHFAISSLEENPRDISAISNPIADDNDKQCALIKFRTSLSDLRFYSDYGLVNISREEGEYWLWVSQDIRSFEVEHPEYPIIIYELNQELKSKHVYILKTQITEEKDIDVIKPVESERTIRSDPGRAKVYLDDKYIGRTPLTYKTPSIPYYIKLKKSGYDSLVIYDDILENLKGYMLNMNYLPRESRWFISAGLIPAYYSVTPGFEFGLIGSTGISFGFYSTPGRYWKTGSQLPEELEYQFSNYSNRSTIISLQMSQQVLNWLFLKAGMGRHTAHYYNVYYIVDSQSSLLLVQPMDRVYELLNEDGHSTMFYNASAVIRIKKKYLIDVGLTLTPNTYKHAEFFLNRDNYYSRGAKENYYRAQIAFGYCF